MQLFVSVLCLIVYAITTKLSFSTFNTVWGQSQNENPYQSYEITFLL